MRAVKAFEKARALLNAQGLVAPNEHPQLVEVAFNACLPGGGTGVYAYAQFSRTWASCHFTKGGLCVSARFGEHEEQLMDFPTWDIHQY